MSQEESAEEDLVSDEGQVQGVSAVAARAIVSSSMLASQVARTCKDTAAELAVQLHTADTLEEQSGSEIALLPESGAPVELPADQVAEASEEIDAPAFAAADRPQPVEAEDSTTPPPPQEPDADAADTSSEQETGPETAADAEPDGISTAPEQAAQADATSSDTAGATVPDLLEPEPGEPRQTEPEELGKAESEEPIEFDTPLIVYPYMPSIQPQPADSLPQSVDEEETAEPKEEIDISDRSSYSRFGAPSREPGQAGKPEEPVNPVEPVARQEPEPPQPPPAWLENLLRLEPKAESSSLPGEQPPDEPDRSGDAESLARVPIEEKPKTGTPPPETTFPAKPVNSSIETRIDLLAANEEAQIRFNKPVEGQSTSVSTLLDHRLLESTLLLAPATGPVSTSWDSEFIPSQAPVKLELPGYPAQMPKFDVGSRVRVLARGNPGKKQVALTFDDGPHPEFTSQILTVLAHYDVHATFFFVGLQSQKYPQWVQMTYQAGHEIASQTYDHFRMPKLPLEEKIYQIDEYQRLIEGLIGVTPRFLRPPGGQLDDETERLIKERNMVLGLWDVALNDTKNGRTAEEMLDVAFENLRPGSVFLAHDGVQATVDMLPELIETLRAKGYEFVTMSEMAAGL